MAFDFEHEDKSVEALLKNTPYHSLKDKLVEEAVEKLAKIKSEIDKGLTEEQAIEKLPELEATEQEVIDAEVIEAEIQEEIKVEEAVSELELQHTVDGKLDIQAIEVSIQGCEKGLRRTTFSGMQVMRKIYLDRGVALNILLQKASK